MPLALVFYLALERRRYDSVVYGEVRIATWWLVVLGAVVGTFRSRRLVALGLLVGERRAKRRSEAGRVAAYLGRVRARAGRPEAATDWAGLRRVDGAG